MVAGSAAGPISRGWNLAKVLSETSQKGQRLPGRDTPWLFPYPNPSASHCLKQAGTHVTSIQFSSVAQSCPTLCDLMDYSAQGSQSITNSRSLLKLMSIQWTMPSNHLILCRPIIFLPSIFPSIRVFSNESVLRIRWPKYWSFSFSISPSNEYSGLISIKIDWLDLLAVQGTLKNLLQHHSSKASILWHSAF